MSIRPKAVFFDWDGTLVDTIPGIFAAHNHVREVFGQPLWSKQEFRDNLKHSSRELYPRIYGAESDRAIKILYGYIEENAMKTLEKLDGAVEILELLRSKAIPMAVVSNKRHDYLQKEVAHTGWRNYFGSVIGAGYAANDKPAADPILKAIEESGTAFMPADVLYVGDTVTDMLAAQAAGCPSVLITHGEQDKKDLLMEFTPVAAPDNCRQFLDLLRGWVN